MVYKDTVYLFTGHDEDDAPDVGFKMFNWKCYTSTDMKNWRDRGTIASTANFSWATKNSAWAAQCVFRNGKFYFYCPVTQKKMAPCPLQ
jgi:arabinoxylan arabinofuranohydrolase